MIEAFVELSDLSPKPVEAFGHSTCLYHLAIQALCDFHKPAAYLGVRVGNVFLQCLDLLQQSSQVNVSHGPCPCPPAPVRSGASAPVYSPGIDLARLVRYGAKFSCKAR